LGSNSYFFKKIFWLYFGPLFTNSSGQPAKNKPSKIKQKPPNKQQQQK
jgi:hypothetical protein